MYICHLSETLKIVRFITIIAGLLTPHIASAEYIFTAPPRENATKGAELYSPITEELSAILGEKVVYVQPNGWLDYAKKMRSGFYDIVFDGPHFTAWRIIHLDHIPIVSLPGKLGFYLVVNSYDEEISKPRDLVGQKICGMASPHLATDMIYDLYKNPVLQPLIYDIKGTMRDVFKAFKAGKCRGTIFRDVAFKRLPESEKSKLKIIARTRTLPNQTITISDRLKSNADKLAEFFTSKAGLSASDGVLSRYSKKKKFFLDASVSEYNGVEGILEDVVWGW